MRSPKIAVIGSLNMDSVFQCNQLPLPGQTILSTGTAHIPGGKGANQAVAAAKTGGDVFMIGRVGDDAFANQLTVNLDAHNVNTSNVFRTAGCDSGFAAVMVDQRGQNSIVVSAGANAYLSPNDLDTIQVVIQDCDIVLLQLEIPIATVERAIKIAKQSNVPILLDPAPVTIDAIQHDIFDVDFICPNETEAEILTDLPVKNIQDAENAAVKLLKLGPKTVIITMSDKGTLVHDGQRSHFIPPNQVKAIDSTAAGDAFAGAFAVKFSNTKCVYRSARYASIAGSLSATRNGAQTSMPTNEEILSFYGHQK
jgi:ribokinase